jgi:hypothetical protein
MLDARPSSELPGAGGRRALFPVTDGGTGRVSLLAWRHDLGDETPAAAAAAFREFLAKWGEKFPDTREASWARERIALHEGGE